MVFKPPKFHEQEPEIESENPNHERLESAVANALATAYGIDASDVSVTAKGGRVSLSGNVLWPAEVDRAVEIAMAVPGVEKVHVDLNVAESITR